MSSFQASWEQVNAIKAAIARQETRDSIRDHLCDLIEEIEESTEEYGSIIVRSSIADDLRLIRARIGWL